MSPTIYYVPSRETEAVLVRLAKGDPSRKFQATARECVTNINGPAILLWGSGDQHDTSHLFSPRGRFSKIIFDGHYDNYFMEKPLAYYNHAGITAASRSCDDLTVHTFDLDDPLDVVEHEGKFRVSYTSVPEVRKRPVHVSVDLDCIAGFPAFPNFQPPRAKGFSLEEVRRGIAAVRENQNRLIRFDIGGLYIPQDEDYGCGLADPRDCSVLDFGIECYGTLLREAELAFDVPGRIG